MKRWTLNHMPDQSGRIVIITGANSGLGLDTTRALARAGAHIVMACRSPHRSQAALETVQQEIPHASLELMPLDLSSLQSVHAFADTFRRAYTRLDLLINNAGLMATPRQLTEEGFEMQFGVNHLGHFVLTARLIDLLVATPNSRVVTLTSSANWFGTLDFEDLMGEKNYSRYGAYCQSKLANVVFGTELHRRLEAAGVETISNSAHPGLVMTNLQQRATHQSGSRIESIVYDQLLGSFAQSSEMGILPQLYAATAPQAQGGKLYGPKFHVRGYPRAVRPNRAALDPATRHRLWTISEELTGVRFEVPHTQPVHTF